MEFFKYGILAMWGIGMLMFCYGLYCEHCCVLKSREKDPLNPFIDHTQLMPDQKKYIITTRIGAVLILASVLLSWVFGPGA